MALMSNLSEVLGGTVAYETYLDGQRFLGTSSIDLSDFEFETVEISGAGIGGKIQLSNPYPRASMECTLHFRNVTKNIAELLKPQRQNLSFYADQQVYDASKGIYRHVTLKVEGGFIPKKATLGKVEISELADTEMLFECVYIKVTCDNEVLLENDPFNYVLTINGVDYGAPVKKAVGLSTTIGDVINAVLN